VKLDTSLEYLWFRDDHDPSMVCRKGVASRAGSGLLADVESMGAKPTDAYGVAVVPCLTQENDV